jgi:uncharacterized phage infection (PIP) family protein YhgE
MADEKIMSQADIDALVVVKSQEEPTSTRAATKDSQAQAAPARETIKSSQTQAAPAREMKATPTRPATRDVPRAAISHNEAENTRAMVADLAERVARIEATLGKLDQLQKMVTEIKAISQQLQDIQAMVKQLREVAEQVEDISLKLRSTPAYDIGELFKCNSCGSKGLVAIRIKCTDCGRENWWGWWPEE